MFLLVWKFTISTDFGNPFDVWKIFMFLNFLMVFWKFTRVVIVAVDYNKSYQNML